MFASDAVLDLRFLPQPSVSAVIREGVGDFARLHDVDREDLAPFLTALGEAVANAIEHARVTRSIEVEVRIGADRIVATVHDDGVGFDAPANLEPALPDAYAERGRGLPIISRCSDIFAVRSMPGKGTEILLGRYLRRGRKTNVA